MPIGTPVPRFSQLMSAACFLASLPRGCHLIKVAGIDCQDLLEVAMHLIRVVMVLRIGQLCCISDNQPIHSLQDIAELPLLLVACVTFEYPRMAGRAEGNSPP